MRDNVFVEVLTNLMEREKGDHFDITKLSSSDTGTEEDVLNEIFKGYWGNGRLRYILLSLAGWDAVKIQTAVNTRHWEEYKEKEEE